MQQQANHNLDAKKTINFIIMLENKLHDILGRGGNSIEWFKGT